MGDPLRTARGARTGKPDPAIDAEAVAARRLTPDDADERTVGRAVPNAMVELGSVVGARSGDKGGSASVGVLVRSDAAAWPWRDGFLTVDRPPSPLPETADLDDERDRFPNLRAPNLVIHGLVQEGVAASTRRDGQAKSLGECLRARVGDLPASLVPAGAQ